jgi:hypothetical protein
VHSIIASFKKRKRWRSIGFEDRVLAFKKDDARSRDSLVDSIASLVLTKCAG